MPRSSQLVRTDSPICVALDVRERASADALVEGTRPYAGAFKVGLTAFASLGPDYVTGLAGAAAVFVDLKLHDIPMQVAGAVTAVRELGAAYVTVHASGGPAMVRAAADAAGEDLVVLGVTVLTSLGDAGLAALGWRGTAAETVLRLGESALSAGARGLVCSPLEVAALRAEFGAEPVLVVPGIRAGAEPAGDQARTASAAEALRSGADLLVVGRPISAAPDPAEAARALLRQARAVRP